MPLINGCKYSCEPCIRGHRATFCVHTDRILIEVRKPGRPLEKCEHNLATCSCGKMADFLSMKNGVPNPGFQIAEEDKNATLVIATPPVWGIPAPRPRAPSRVQKRTKKKPGSPADLPAALENSLAKSAAQEQQQQQEKQQSKVPSRNSPSHEKRTLPAIPALDSFQASNNRLPPAFQSNLPPVQLPQPTAPQHVSYNQENFQRPQTFTNPTSKFCSYSQGMMAQQPAHYLSLIEDVARVPGHISQQFQAGQNQPYIQSQYIMARQDSVWRGNW
ncbi:hypothetical protein G7Y89_g14467 [Cudoniella acicularis]|uniref:Copper-fist domain-containing protein n=1 Tax=Cudoniella acicularis TaxID=354080 RepID=A0A8H4R3Z0_9HELO|nr:hypothetical protein G7Y89_g14467 [Cudoniella acicularis]